MTTAETMKRSTAMILYVTPLDFRHATLGRKTATSRLGNRLGLWPVGSRVNIVDNEEGASRQIEIVYNVLMTLGQISPTQAGNIGGYGVRDHYNDFTSIYPGSDDDTELSLVGFRVL